MAENVPEARPADDEQRAIIRVLLADSTEYLVTDMRTIDGVKLFQEFMDNIPESNQIPVTQFEPAHVLYVLKNVARFVEVFDEFRDSPEYIEAERRWSWNEILKIMDVADFLNCRAVLDCMGCLAADCLKTLTEDEIMDRLGLEVNMEESELPDLRDALNWVINT